MVAGHALAALGRRAPQVAGADGTQASGTSARWLQHHHASTAAREGCIEELLGVVPLASDAGGARPWLALDDGLALPTLALPDLASCPWLGVPGRLHGGFLQCVLLYRLGPPDGGRSAGGAGQSL